MRCRQTIGHANRCQFRKNQGRLHHATEALESPIALKSAFDPKKPHFEPRSQSLNSNRLEFGARQFAVVTGYCVYEKKKNREIKNPKQIKLKNGRPAIKGTCASCGKQIFRIGKLK